MPHAASKTGGMRISRSLVPLVVVVALASSSCAGTTTPGTEPIAAPVEVIGQGTVIQTGSDPAELCLGAVAESYPPQCTGVELVSWDWASVEGFETSGTGTWGTYAVWGVWDGVTLTISDAVMLALYDPMPIEEPLLDPVNAGKASEGTLTEVHNSIGTESPVEVLMSRIENGYVFVDVVHDYGDVQAWADQQYGEGVVVVTSALRDVNP